MGSKAKTNKNGLKKKKSKRKLTKVKLLKMASAAAFKIYGQQCLICKQRKATGSHHYFGKQSHPSVMFDLRNLIPACFRCHIVQIHQQGDTEHARQVLIERLGLIGFFKLEKDAHAQKKLSLLDLDSVQAELLSVLNS